MWVPDWLGEPYLRISSEGGQLEVDDLQKELKLGAKMLNQTILKLRYNLLLSAVERGKYLVTPPATWLAIAGFLTEFPELETDFKNIFLDGLCHVKGLFLFGSRAVGTADSESDYDLLAIVDTPLVRDALLEQTKNLASRGVNFEVYSVEGLNGILKNRPLYLRFALSEAITVFDDLRFRDKYAGAKVTTAQLWPEIRQIEKMLKRGGDIYLQVYVLMHALRTLTSIEMALGGDFRSGNLNKKVREPGFKNREEIRRVYRRIANFDEKARTKLTPKSLKDLKKIVGSKLEKIKARLK